MENKLTWTHHIAPSMCDTRGLLGIPDAFDLFMDMASVHSDHLGNGVSTLWKKNQYWVTTKTLIKIFRRPAMADRVVLSTWPEALKGRTGLKGNRQYEIRSQEGELLLAGKTEWIILDKNSDSYLDVRTVYPEDFDFCRDIVCPQSFFKIKDDFETEPFASYKVQNLDTDFVGHMNNVAYIRAFANCFSAKEWRRMDIKELEIHFRRPCFEGDVLDFSSRPGTDGYTEVLASVSGASRSLLRYK